MLITILSYAAYLCTGIVVTCALIRSARIEGLQWWAYVGYTINSVVLCSYAYMVDDHVVLLNQGMLLLTNAVGLVRWRGR